MVEKRGKYARAVQIATEAHAGQTDKAGAPYLMHPLRVAAAVHRPDEKLVAVLHDVVEDSNWTLDRLREEGFSDAVVAAVDALTHREGEDYFDAARRAGANPLARVVKIADLADNMDKTRLGTVTPKEKDRMAKYARAFEMLTSDR